MEIEGILICKGEIQLITTTFEKQEFVIEFAENPLYPEFIKFELIQGNCGKIDKFEIGSELTVSFNLKGRKWGDPNGGTKYFNTLQAWKIICNESNMSQEPTSFQENETLDDLPF